jgi:transcriptional regulator with XRE-family HTH domain
MNLDNDLTDGAVLAELGERLRRARLGRNLTQRQLAGEAGVSEVTINKMEKGEPTQTLTLIRVLRSLGLLQGLDAAIPEPLPSPIDQLRRRGHTRQRASSPRMGTPARRAAGPWRWGDEEGDRR